MQKLSKNKTKTLIFSGETLAKNKKNYQSKKKPLLIAKRSIEQLKNNQK